MVLRLMKKLLYSNCKKKNNLTNIKYLNSLSLWESSVKTIKKVFYVFNLLKIC